MRTILSRPSSSWIYSKLAGNRRPRKLFETALKAGVFGLERQHSVPLLLPSGSGDAVPLKPVPQQAGGDAVSEAYIQALVHEHPACLPIAEIDAMFAGPVEAIAEYLQLHAGLHFSLGLVELPIYAMPNGDRLVAPRVLARTALVTRNVVAVHLVDRVSVAYAMHAILDEWKAGGAVKDQLGGTAKLSTTTRGTLDTIIDSLEVGSLEQPEVRKKAFRWLAERVNTFVNVLRPRMRSAAADYQSRGE